MCKRANTVSHNSFKAIKDRNHQFYHTAKFQIGPKLQYNADGKLRVIQMKVFVFEMGENNAGQNYLIQSYVIF